MKRRIITWFLVLAMIFTSIPLLTLSALADAVTTDTQITLNPDFVEIWVGFNLDCKLKTTVTGTNTSQKITYYSEDEGIATISSDGNIAAVSAGTTYVYAKAADGTTSNRVKVTILAEGPFDYSDPNQLLTLGDGKANQTISQCLAWPTGSYGSANIAAWYNNTTGVLTMTADDNLMGDFPTWLSLYQTYGTPTTLMAPTSSYWESGNYWAYIMEMGMDVQSHSHYHRSSGEYSSGTTTSAMDWMDFYLGWKEVLEATGNYSKVIAYPCGYNNATYSKLLYIAGRGTMGALNSGSPNYNQTASKSGVISTADIQSTIASGGWYSIHFHNIGGSLSNLEAFYKEAQKYIQNGSLWATTFSNASMYGQERDTATLTVLKAEANEIEFSLTDRMMDSMYDQELTIKILVDSTWTAARASQNGVALNAKVQTVSGKTYVLVNAIPDRGNVVVVKTALESLSQTDTQIKYTPTTTTNSISKEIASEFTVDSSWNRVYATQNGARVPAYIEEIYGVGKVVHVTAIAGNGEVVVTKTDSNIDLSSVTSITMTDVYNNDCTPVSSVPVTISSVEEWEMFASLVNTGKQTFSGIEIKLTTDLDFGGKSYTKVGWELEYSSSSSVRVYFPFSGTLNGQGHKITGLNLEKTVNDQGLFGHTNGATIKDLDVEGTIYGKGLTGGLVGHASNTTIQNCSFTGTITVEGTTNVKSGNTAGGLVGSLSSSNIISCTVNATVEVINNLAIGNGNTVGGITGAVSGASVIQNSSFVGTVSGGSYVGGIVGYTSGGTIKIADCSISADIEGYTYVGGLVGNFTNGNSAKMANCVFEGTVSGYNTVGGAVGYMGPSNRVDGKNLFISAKVIATAKASEVSTLYVGVIAGNIEAGNNATGLSYVYYVDGLNDSSMKLFVGTGTKGAYVTANPITKANLDGTATNEFGTSTVLKTSQVVTALNNWAKDNTSYLGLALNAWTLQNGASAPNSLVLPTYTVTFLDENGVVIGTKEAQKGGTCVAPTAPDREGMVFDHWTLSIENVKADMTVSAVYVPAKTVTFLGYNGTTLEKQKVAIGKDAIPPEAPEVEGYRFVRWTGDFSNVTDDVTITAVYETLPEYTVTFYGKDGALLQTGTVYEGKAATAPKAPDVSGYAFVGWDTSFDNVSGNLEVHAIYKKEYTVTFLSKDKASTLKEEVVLEGEDATAPTIPSVDEYRFVKWSTTFTNVTENLTVEAIYEAIPKYTVIFQDEAGTTLSSQSILEGSDAVAPEAPDKAGYRFVGWSVSYTNVTTSITTVATYKQEFTVSFYEKDGTTLISDVKVLIGEDAVAPNAPNVYGFTFTGWSNSISNVQGSFSVTAQYSELQKYTVTFKDEDGSVISTVSVYKGYDAKTPSISMRDGYVFSGWSSSVKNVQSDLIVTAIYKQYNPNAIWDGTSISTDLMGSGTKADPYLIVTPEDLVYFIKSCSSATKDTYYKLYGNIHLNDSSLKNKLDVTTSTFAGHLDGNGKTIYYLYGSSLVKELSGTIENLTIEGAKITGGNDTVYGFIAQDAKGGAILRNVKVLNSSVVANTSGLLFGRATGGTILIEECETSGTVTTMRRGNSTAGGFFGKIVGVNTITINDSINRAIVSNDSGASNTSLGGFIGYLEANSNGTGSINFNRCKNEGNVVSNSSSSSCGGFVGNGYRNGTVTFISCTNNATITNNGTGGTGGFYGSLSSNTGSQPSGFYFENCVNNGKVSGAGEGVGGFVGAAGATNKGTLYTYSSTNNGEIVGKGKVGGFIGSTTPSGQNIPLVYINCANYGRVKATESYAGGFSGYQKLTTSGKILSVISSVQKGSVEANTYASAVLGGIDYTGSNKISVEISKSYLEGTVTVSTSGLAAQLIGQNNTQDFTLTWTDSYQSIKVVKGTTEQTSPVSYYGKAGAEVNESLTTFDESKWTDGTILLALNTYAQEKKYLTWEATENYPKLKDSSTLYGVVIFKDSDGSILSKVTYLIGDTIAKIENLTKDADMTGSYEFLGWDSEVSDTCIGNVVYTAQYKITYINYTVVFKDGDTILSTETYHYGDPVVAPKSPTKAQDNTYTYKFSGWSPVYSAACKGSVTYYSVYTQTYIEYTVTFTSEGKTISSKTYHYGDPIVIPSNPTKAQDNNYVYTFSSWSDEVSSTCKGNTEYIANFTSALREYTIIFKNGNTTISSEVYHYDDPIVIPANPTKESDDHYDYTFTSWKGDVSNVCKGNATYIAQYSQSESPSYLSRTKKAELLAELDALGTITLSSHSTLLEVQSEMGSLLDADKVEVETKLAEKIQAYESLVNSLNTEYEKDTQIQRDLLTSILVTTVATFTMLSACWISTRRWF